nr:NAD-glutamate dehydrogenase domain-containing protein [Luteimonas sp. JM171]
MTTSRKSPARKPTAASKAAKKSPARTARAAKAGKASRSARLAPIFSAIRSLAGKERQEDASLFAKAFYHRLTDDELPLHTPEAWAALANDFLDFARKRKPGTANVRLFNPSRETHGWESGHTVLQVVNDDMPFLVDSVTMALADLGIGVHVLGHPVVPIRRGRGGKLEAVGEGESESLIHMEIDRQSGDALQGIQDAVVSVLEDVRLAVGDWEAMRGKMLEVASGLATSELPVPQKEREEAQEFLRWLADDHFTFLGYREYEVRRKRGDAVLAPVEGSSLGLMRGREAGPARPLASLSAHEVRKTGRIDPLILTKTNSRSTVHRPGYMDYVGVVEYDADGNAVSERRFIGLYASSAYNRRPWDIPLVRERFEHVMATSGLRETGHSGKALKHILETLPRDELFQSTAEELARLGIGVLQLQERIRSRLFIRRDRYGHFYSILAYVPRERFNTEVRLKVEALLKRELEADRVDSSVRLDESPLAQVHLIVRPRPGAQVEVDEARLEKQLADVVRNWLDDLRDELVMVHGEADGMALFERFGRPLGTAYIQEAGPAVAAADVSHLASVGEGVELRPRLYRAPAPAGGEGPGKLRLKLFTADRDLPLSDVLPMMENMGLRVIAEHLNRISADGRTLFIQDFEVEAGAEIDLDSMAPEFEDAFVRLWRGEAENDGFNKLILAASLDWRQVSMLRAYCKYLLQIDSPFSQAYMEQTLLRHPLVARLLVELFEARFAPKGRDTDAARLRAQFELLAGGDAAAAAALKPVAEARRLSRDGRQEKVRDALRTLLDRVASLDEDRILRSFMGVIDATLRTSFYQRGKDGNDKDYAAFKLDCARVPDLPKPHPYREVFVYGPHVEGVHLRYGMVARGGLRWSDRREDFRTEVLGLAKAQAVKNTVIVPVGAKGGFIAKRLPEGGDRDAIQAEGIACYKRFISGLLDVTDNIVDGEIVPPQDVVRHDDVDTYMVVAADKGTATFSDIANGISAEYNFWLGDAFASGGSVGYDHKGMGITAKGAWESVKRHFRALGIDCQKQDFTVVGIGDMSGDVFGNGMRLSKHIRLVGAFDHRHVFIDPDPDAAKSFKERDRLFKTPRSSWDDYDRKLISKGGGVWPRSAKSIPVSPQMREALGLEEDVKELSPNDLIKAVLRAPVDLLWNGGIGTYVKGSSETQADVGDRANNAVRVNGGELRARIVGEGGNLGFTQLGRIEAAQAGVILNADFIDNSGGVGTSDREVNIKILLNAQVRKGKLALKARNKLLLDMTHEVETLVLWDNIRQNQALSLMERMSVPRLGSKQHFIRTLEAQGLLDRQIEYLPSDAELAARKARDEGLTRPELAVLLSYSKQVVYDQLLDSDIPEDPYLSKELQRYFPTPLQKKYAAAMEEHPLKREIIATAVTNATINRMGATFIMRMQEDTGRTAAEVAKAYTIGREVLNARTLWSQLEELDGKVPEAVQIDALLEIWNLQRSFVRWLLNRPGPMPGITDAVARYSDGFNAIRSADGILPDSQRPGYDARRAGWRERGMPAQLAEDLAELPYLEPVFDIIELAAARKLKPVEVAKVHYRVGDALRLPWLFDQIDALEVQGRWHAVARGVLRDDLAARQIQLTGQALSARGGDADAKVQAWLGRDDASLRFTLSMLEEMFSQKSLDYPTASVAVSVLSQIAG